MRMRVKWYKMGIYAETDGTHHLKEIPHINGRYCKRNDVESIIERINEQIVDSTDAINHLINDINEIRAASDTDTTKKCDSVIKRLHELQKRTKKCKRPENSIEMCDVDAGCDCL